MAKKIALEELKSLCVLAKGKINKVYLHWSAGHYGQQFSDYHILVDKDGTFYSTTDDLTQHLNHTYFRNTGGVSIGAMCMVGATTEDFGDEPLTSAQVESIAQIMAVLSTELDLPLGIWNFLTHAEAANNLDGENPGYESNGCPDGIYGPSPNPDGSQGGDCERWDLWILRVGDVPWSGGATLRGKAVWYQNQGAG